MRLKVYFRLLNKKMLYFWDYSCKLFCWKLSIFILLNCKAILWMIYILITKVSIFIFFNKKFIKNIEKVSQSHN